MTDGALASWIDSEDYRGSTVQRGAGYANYSADENSRVLEARSRYRRDLEHRLDPGSKVLEVGCATASLLSVIREHGHDVLGVDLSPSFANSAKALYGIEVRVGNILEIDLPPSCFDAILAMGTVSNFRDFHACLTRFRALLKPGGFLMLNFPDADSLLVRLAYRQRFWMFTPSVGTFMTSRGCVAALSRAGFESIKVASDVQRPSLRKLLHHAKAGFLLRPLSRLGLADAPAPLAFPVPTVRLVVAKA